MGAPLVDHRRACRVSRAQAVVVIVTEPRAAGRSRFRLALRGAGPTQTAHVRSSAAVERVIAGIPVLARRSTAEGGDASRKINAAGLRGAVFRPARHGARGGALAGAGRQISTLQCQTIEIDTGCRTATRLKTVRSVPHQGEPPSADWRTGLRAPRHARRDRRGYPRGNLEHREALEGGGEGVEVAAGPLPVGDISRGRETAERQRHEGAIRVRSAREDLSAGGLSRRVRCDRVGQVDARRPPELEPRSDRIAFGERVSGRGKDFDGELLASRVCAAGEVDGELSDLNPLVAAVHLERRRRVGGGAARGDDEKKAKTKR
jgi:hypothetical protein